MVSHLTFEEKKSGTKNMRQHEHTAHLALRTHWVDYSWYRVMVVEDKHSVSKDCGQVLALLGPVPNGRLVCTMYAHVEPHSSINQKEDHYTHNRGEDLKVL